MGAIQNGHQLLSRQAALNCYVLEVLPKDYEKWFIQSTKCDVIFRTIPSLWRPQISGQPGNWIDGMCCMVSLCAVKYVRVNWEDETFSGNLFLRPSSSTCTVHLWHNATFHWLFWDTYEKMRMVWPQHEQYQYLLFQ